MEVREQHIGCYIVNDSRTEMALEAQNFTTEADAIMCACVSC